jgi:hypothetical protein
MDSLYGDLRSAIHIAVEAHSPGEWNGSSEALHQLIGLIQANQPITSDPPEDLISALHSMLMEGGDLSRQVVRAHELVTEVFMEQEGKEVRCVRVCVGIQLFIPVSVVVPCRRPRMRKVRLRRDAPRGFVRGRGGSL